jgi:hypothetical protein
MITIFKRRMQQDMFSKPIGNMLTKIISLVDAPILLVVQINSAGFALCNDTARMLMPRRPLNWSKHIDNHASMVPDYLYTQSLKSISRPPPPLSLKHRAPFLTKLLKL